MKKSILLSLAVCFFAAANAQKHCYTDEVQEKLEGKYPEIKLKEAQLKRQIDARIKGLDFTKLAKTTATFADKDTVYHVPIVFHVIHGYGPEYVSDNEIYQSVVDINKIYNALNADTVDIIPPYKGNIPGTGVKYNGKANIIFHLATIDPNGNPTHGITRKLSHLTSEGGDQAKYDIWAPDQYMNIWLIQRFDTFHNFAAAYAYKPATAAILPYYDGVISLSSYLNRDNTISHELGHTLTLSHPWGNNNNSGVACGDDGIDDTPPTKGHNPPNGPNGCTPENLYDTECVLKNTDFAKQNINAIKDKTITQNGIGIDFRVFDRVHIDRVSFYPTQNGVPFQIAFKRNGTTLSTYNGVTSTASHIFSAAQVGKTIIDSSAIADSINGQGISFLTYDSVKIDNVTFYPADSVARPYQIVLKQNGVVIDSLNGTTNAITSAQTANVNFYVPADSINAYSIEFSKNPNVRRDTANTNYIREIPGEIKITNDASSGYYNYFYKINIRFGNFLQQVPLNFVAASNDTNATYRMEFSVNPGIKVDTFAVGYTKFIPDVIQITNDQTSGYYNGLYNWQLRYGNYYKFYDSATAKAYFGITTSAPLYVDYPDTVNSQNVMDYTYCSKMFTYLQNLNMRASLEDPTANRNNLIALQNLKNTGVKDQAGNLVGRLDFSPTADFSIDNFTDKSFVCGNSLGNSTPPVNFINRSWNDTVISAQWTFSNGATQPASSNIPFVNGLKFATPGWVTATLTVQGNNTGTDSIVKERALYIADPNPVDPIGYFGEFDPTKDLDKYPMFNYYNNAHKWEYMNTIGYYDNTSIKYNNFDDRPYPQSAIGRPNADFDDFFTPGFDLQNLSNNFYLNFFSAGAFRTNQLNELNDELLISYTTDCGSSWTPLKTLTAADIGNNGTITYSYTPSYSGEWKGQSIKIPTNLRFAERVFFRFRFKVGGVNNFGTGNNFFLDRINISDFTASVNEIANTEKQIALAPNPTTSGTTVIIKTDKNRTADVRVTDITGKLIYQVNATLSGNVSSIEIPASAISVKGIYMVHVVTGSKSFAEKLVVY